MSGPATGSAGRSHRSKLRKAPIPSVPVKAPYRPLPETVARGPGGKLGELAQLMRRPEGATIAEMIALTGWKEHSVRGAIAGTLKKRFGLPVISEKTEGARVYRIAS